eukprot:PhF_6_TR39662/c0_g1_i2/m.58872/K01049/ACHE; acetylcholinesterase
MGFFVVLQLIAVVVMASSAAPNPPPIVNTTAGPVQGLYFSAYPSNIYLGIPYAQPPVGNLRFAPPLPAASWTTPFNATQFGDGCMQVCGLQHPESSCPAKMSENCLNLNIFGPANATGLPVWVFFPGGRYLEGAAGVPMYHGSKMAFTQNIIVVTVDYRLGVYGALYTTADAATGVQGNYNLLDQQLALRWVQNNIKAFGGDPSRVTISGQSAGAFSVMCHMASPASKGLFAQGHLMSNPYGLLAEDTTTAPMIANVFLKNVGCPATTDPSHVACIRNKSATEILIAQNKTNFPFSLQNFLTLFLPWTPIAGTALLPQQPMYAAVNGTSYNNVPILIGTVQHEAIMFVFSAMKTPVAWFEADAVLALVFGFSNIGGILKRYPVDTAANDVRYWLSEIVTDYLFVCPTRYITRATADQQKAATYLYEYTHVLSFSQWLQQQWYPECVGYVCHGTDLVLLFSATDVIPNAPTPTPQEQTLSVQHQRYVGNFVTTGNPNSPKGVPVTWNLSSVGMVLNITTPVSSSNGFHDADCDFWDSVGYNRR